jgi:hypothetical protein
MRRISRNQWVFALVLAAVTAAYYLVPWTTLPARAAIGVPFLLLHTVILPGIALKWLFPRRRSDWLETAAYVSADGLAFLLVLAFLWALSGVSISTFRNVLGGAITALGAAAALRGPRTPAADAMPLARRDHWLLAALTAIALLVFGLVLATGPPLDTGRDTLAHVAYVDEIAATGIPFPTTSFYSDAGRSGGDIRMGLLHTVYGFYAATLGVGALPVLRGMNAVMILLILLVVYAATYGFFRSRITAVLAVAFMLLDFEYGVKTLGIRLSFVPSHAAVVYLLLFLAASLRFLEHKSTRSLIACAVYAFAGAAMHVQYAVLIPFATAVILVWKPCFDTGSWRAHLGSVVAIASAVALGVIPYGAYRYLTDYQVADAHARVWGVLFVTDRLFVIEPFVAWRIFGTMGAAAVLAIVPLWKARKRYPALGYLMASFFTVALVQFNPFLMPVFRHVIAYLTGRLGIVFPHHILAAYFAVDYFSSKRLGTPGSPFRHVAMAVLALVVVGNAASIFKSNVFSGAFLAAERKAGAEPWAGGLRYLSHLPDREVIASDPVTSYTIAAFTPHYVVSTMYLHTAPNDLRAHARTIAARDILSPYTSASDKARAMAAERATLVVVNDRFTRSDLSDYWSVSPQSVPIIIGRFREMPRLFEEVAVVDGLHIYRWTGETPPPEETIVNPLLRATLPAGAKPVGEKAGVAICAGVEIGPRDSVRAGDVIDVTVYWTRERELPLERHMVSLRFDRADLSLPLGGKPFPKLTRKLVERARGERYRFRADHKLTDGFFDPDVWPAGYYVVDETTVRIPGDAAPGRYTVRAILLVQLSGPNIQLRDLFFDDDLYQGVPIGEIFIAPRSSPNPPR